MIIYYLGHVNILIYFSLLKKNRIKIITILISFHFGPKRKPVIDGMFTLLYSSLQAAVLASNLDLLSFSKTLNVYFFC